MINISKIQYAKKIWVSLAFLFLVNVVIGRENRVVEKIGKVPPVASIVQASLDAVGTVDARIKIANIIALANCKSIKGDYQTEVHTSLSSGYTFFKQIFSYSAKPFEAVILNEGKGIQINKDLLSNESVFAIRSHEFHAIVLQIADRLNSFHQPVLIKGDNNRYVYMVKAKDELTHDCTVFFDAQTKLLKAVNFQDPADDKVHITITFTDWRAIGQLRLPYHIDIKQGDKRFAFDYTKILLNNPGFQEKKIA